MRLKPVLCWMCLVCLLFACGDDDKLSGFVYVFDNDTLARDAWEGYFTEMGQDFTAVTLSDAAGKNFTECRAILVARDTFYTNAGTVTWAGRAAARDRIRDSGQLVVGLGLGGRSYLGPNGGINLSIGQTESILFSDFTEYSPVGATADLSWHSPLDPWADVTATNTVRLHTAVVPCAGASIVGSIPAGVTNLVLKNTGYPTQVMVGYQPVAGQTFVLWAFTGAPDIMTVTGKRLFLNLLYNLETK